MTDEEFQKSWEEVGGLKMFGPWRDHPGNEASKKKFQIQAVELVLMVDSAENEYEADVYFCSNDLFRQQWVDY